MTVSIRVGDCREVMAEMDAASVDAIVTDPPYDLNFMGKAWDRSGVAFDPETWIAALRVLKPGGHLLAMGGTRTVHRMTCAIEDAGFEIRDQCAYLYGSGFPKSHNISKALDKAAGAEREVVGKNGGRYAYGFSDAARDQFRGMGGSGFTGDPETIGLITAPATDLARQWDGWGTALKPAMELIVMARNPLIGTVARNISEHGTGALNIDGCRIDPGSSVPGGGGRRSSGSAERFNINGDTDGGLFDRDRVARIEPHDLGRWPANVLLGCACAGDDHEPGCAVAMLDAQSGERDGGGPSRRLTGHYDRGGGASWMGNRTADGGIVAYSDAGGASRFFYTAKSSRAERNKGLAGMPERVQRMMNDYAEGGSNHNSNNPKSNFHPTVKPVSLMQWLCRLITPPKGTVLDPFMGSGTTGIAADREGFHFIGIEISREYADIARQRITGDAPMFAAVEMEEAS